MSLGASETLFRVKAGQRVTRPSSMLKSFENTIEDITACREQQLLMHGVITSYCFNRLIKQHQEENTKKNI